MRDRLIQFACVIIALVAMAVAGSILPRMSKIADEKDLRYTTAAIEGAPPIVAIGTAIGALRGIIVDYLWIKATMQKEKGLFYEAMADAQLITQLQPRFGEVWGFHGHNMAYNISVLTNTPEERWQWVKAGIELVRDQGLRHNPTDLWLNKELAFWLSHKVDGVADDAHLYYKRQWAKEWQFVLGTPPPGWAQRILWMESIRDAPDSLEEAELKTPGVKKLVDQLSEGLSGFDQKFRFRLDKDFLLNEGKWESSRTSRFASLLGLHTKFLGNDPVYATFDRVLGDPANAAAGRTFVDFLRKKVLKEGYNMDPAVMAQYTKEFGPLDWRHPQAHTLYWSRLGATTGADRYDTDDDIYKIVNTDRLTIQAMQALARSGLMDYDPFSNDNPARLNDPRWIKAIDRYFNELYRKHYKTRGAGGDTFSDFHENFMTWAVRDLYRAGDIEGAQAIMDNLDGLYGRGGLIPNHKYAVPMDTFVRESTYGEYEFQPEVARSDVYAALARGFREGLLLGRDQVLKDALRFASQLTDYFRSTKFTDFVNKFGERRMADLLGGLERSVEDVFASVLRDTTQPLIDRLTIYNRADEAYRRLVFDLVKEPMRAEFEASPLREVMPFEQALPEPPNMEEWRIARAEAERAKQEAVDAQNRAVGERK
ncbi:MAG: hypothetical protein EXS00_07330 [Phycisphaerales bacterium]|nr:hypothetical protein [Phycisphaerales bacterium]